jgi:periplasmic divalent cation tolerance protein
MTPGQAAAQQESDGPADERMIVKTACDRQEEAENIAKLLVDQRLAAAVQISTVQSLYWWQGQQYNKPEWVLTCYSRAERWPEIEAAIRSAHSYQLPKIVAFAIDRIPDDYARWLDQYS